MKKKEYTNGDVTISWEPDKCIHSSICLKTLPNVYSLKERPWIKMENAISKELIDQVGKCPSKALSIKKNFEIQKEDDGKKGKYTLLENDIVAGEMTFTWAGDTKFIIDHTEIKDGFNGRGLGKLLVMEAVEFARNNNLKILPLCTFANAVFEKNIALKDVLFR